MNWAALLHLIAATHLLPENREGDARSVPTSRAIDYGVHRVNRIYPAQQGQPTFFGGIPAASIAASRAAAISSVMSPKPRAVTFGSSDWSALDDDLMSLALVWPGNGRKLS